MNHPIRLAVLFALLLGVVFYGNSASFAQMIPAPKEVKKTDGSLQLTSSSRIVTADPSLAPLAKVLSGEIYLATGLRLSTADGASAAGDISIAIDKELKEEQYTIDVADHVTITGGSYVGAAWGTVTLLQSLTTDGGKIAAPKMTINDQPDLPYRSFMQDVARQYVPIESLRSAVVLCRQYKVRYLQLHLGDDHAWTFPSTAYPKLGSHNRGAHSGPAPKVYDLQALKDLVKFADERGVTIIPEVDSPGHTDALRTPMPELWDSPEKPGSGARLGLINMANEDVYPALNTIFGEITDVFKSSPYLHIGCDEVNEGRIKLSKDYETFIAKHNLKSPHDVFGYYVEQLVEIAKNHNKIPIAWEGAALEKVNPKDLVIMMWTENTGGEAINYSKRGFRLINAPNFASAGWKDVKFDRSKVGAPMANFETDLYSFGQPKNAKSIGIGNPMLLGTQINNWESTWEYSVIGARVSVPARNANAWNAPEKRSYDNFQSSFAHTDALLQHVMEPVKVENKITDTFDPHRAIQLLRAHTLFVHPVTVTLSADVPDAQIHYTTDDSKPSAQSPAYDKPLTISDTEMLRVALFDAQGMQLAPEQRLPYDKIDYEKTLTTDKPVKVSGHESDSLSTYINDGFVMKDIWRGWWGNGPTPQSATIDLEKPEAVNRVIVYPYWDGGRYYQYTVEVSIDGKTWKQVVDESKNTEKATPKGQESKFDTVEARYIRLNVLKNSANPGAHIVELRAYGPDSN